MLCIKKPAKKRVFFKSVRGVLFSELVAKSNTSKAKTNKEFSKHDALQVEMSQVAMSQLASLLYCIIEFAK